MARECYDLGLEYGRSEKGKVSVIRCQTGELSKSFKESSVETHERGTGSWKTTLEGDRFCEESVDAVLGSKCRQVLDGREKLEEVRRSSEDLVTSKNRTMINKIIRGFLDRVREEPLPEGRDV